jgi:hypothetical protein
MKLIVNKRLVFISLIILDICYFIYMFSLITTLIKMEGIFEITFSGRLYIYSLFPVMVALNLLWVLNRDINGVSSKFLLIVNILISILNLLITFVFSIKY